MTWAAHAMHVKITDKHGAAHFEERIAWDGAKLFATLVEHWEKEGGFVQSATREQYDEWRFARGRRH